MPDCNEKKASFLTFNRSDRESELKKLPKLLFPKENKRAKGLFHFLGKMYVHKMYIEKNKIKNKK